MPLRPCIAAIGDSSLGPGEHQFTVEKSALLAGFGRRAKVFGQNYIRRVPERAAQ
jgi:hypothetical protein